MPPPRPDARLAYGPDTNQFLDLRLPFSKSGKEKEDAHLLEIPGAATST